MLNDECAVSGDYQEERKFAAPRLAGEFQDGGRIIKSQ